MLKYLNETILSYLIKVGCFTLLEYSQTMLKRYPQFLTGFLFLLHKNRKHDILAISLIPQPSASISTMVTRMSLNHDTIPRVLLHNPHPTPKT